MARDIDLEWIHGGTIEVLPTIAEGTVLTFGRDRDCSLVLETGDRGAGAEVTDRGISRHAGSIAVDDGMVVVRNTSTTRSIELREPTGLASVISAGGTRAITDLPVTLIITGAIRRHGLRLRTDDPSPSLVSESAGPDASMTQKVPLPTAGQRSALTAMFEGYLVEFPRWDPNPATYEATGTRLGLTETAVRRRIEEYRDKLKMADIAGLEVRDARPALAQFLLSTGIITVEDLDLLPRR